MNENCLSTSNDIGTVDEVESMLAFAVEKNIQPWVEQRKMRDLNQVLRDMESGQARYRFVMVNEGSDFESASHNLAFLQLV